MSVEERYRDALMEIRSFTSRVIGERGDSNPNWGIVMKVDRLAYNALEVREKLATEGLYACPTCGEPVRHYGQRCDRCKRDMEHDRLERESGR